MKQVEKTVVFKTHLPDLVKQYEANTGETLSQGKLGKLAGLSRQTINNWMSGEITLVEANAADRLCRFFNVSLSELVELTEKKNKAS